METQVSVVGSLSHGSLLEQNISAPDLRDLGSSLQVEEAPSRPDSQEYTFQIAYSYPTCSSCPPGCTGDQGKGKVPQKALYLGMPTAHTLEDKGGRSPVSVSI